MKIGANRYQFKRVTLITLATYIGLFSMGIIAVSLTPEASGGSRFERLLSCKNLIKECISYSFAVLFFYFTLNYFYQFITQKKKFGSYLVVSLLGAVGIGINYAISFYYFPSKELTAMNGNKAVMVFSYAIGAIFYIGLSLLIAYLTSLRDERKQRKILEEQKLQLEIEKSQANFNFLKAQINPHFLHNTLNYLYAKSLPYSPELSEGILTLSDIMRYALSDGNIKDGKVLLKDEIEHVRNVIKINQLRFSNNLNVKMEVNGMVNGKTIIPFVMITLVENAFKHGDLKSSEYPINIKLDISDQQICFYCSNKKNTGPKELSTGIGLENIKKRLDLAYGNQYQLKIKDEGNLYSTALIIQTP
jgi:sensor histidine kinase YesM